MNLLKDRWYGFINAMRGIITYFRQENSAWLIWACAPLAIFLGWWLEISTMEWVAVIFAIGLCTSVEILNTAIEETLDHLHPDRHPNVGKAKDLAAGGVLVTAFTAIVIGIVIFGPKLMDKL